MPKTFRSPFLPKLPTFLFLGMFGIFGICCPYLFGQAEHIPDPVSPNSVVVAPEKPRELQAVADAFGPGASVPTKTPYQRMVLQSGSTQVANANANRSSFQEGTIQLASANEPIDLSRKLARNGTNPLRSNDTPTLLPTKTPTAVFTQSPDRVPATLMNGSEYRQITNKQTQPISTVLPNPGPIVDSKMVANSRAVADSKMVAEPIPLPNSKKSGSAVQTAGYLKKPEQVAFLTDLESNPQKSNLETSNPKALNSITGELLVQPEQSVDASNSGSIMDKMLLGPSTKEGKTKPKFALTSDIMPILSVLGSLCLVLGVFFVFVLLLKKVGPRTGGTLPKEAFECIGRFNLNPKLQLNLLRLGNRLILISVTPDGIAETLSEIDHPDEVVQILGMCRKLDAGGSSIQFQSVLDQFAKEKTQGGFFGPEEPKRTKSAQSLSSLLSGGAVYG